MPSDVLPLLTFALAERYRVERELGAGGMATVYLATDLRHDREVAIKVLHPDLGAALGAERFLAEIKVTAKLQHPHILPLLDSGSAGGLLYYVMPLVTGETLRARLAREKQLPIGDALRIANECADALQHAHSLGIIHRDIKPENILLQGGHAVVADFGNALAVQQASGARMTQTGLSLGTPQYMSPEQAMGERTIDARSDIYALGAVTYEMLTGDPPFIGSTVHAIVAKVLTERPTAPSAVRDTVTPPIEHAILRALAKLPADRFGTAAEFSAALSQSNTGGATSVLTSSSGHSASKRTLARRLREPLVLGLLTSTIAATAIAIWRRPSPGIDVPSAIPRVRVEVAIPDSLTLAEVYPWPGAISPDGGEFVFAASMRDGPVRLFRRRMDQLDVTALPPAFAEVNQPMYSPDGKWLAAEGNASHLLRKIRLADGAISDVCACSAANGGDWGVQNEFVLGFEGAHRGLSRVSADGGVPVPLTRTPTGDSITTHMYPIFAGNTDRIVFSIFSQWLNSAELAVTSLADGTVQRLGIKGVRTLAVRNGKIIYARADGVLMTVAFDATARRVTGTPQPIPDAPVVRFNANGNTRIAVGRNSGILTFERHFSALLGWAKGNETPTLVSRERREYWQPPRLSPDGTRIATEIGDITSSHIWIMSVGSGAMTRLSSAPWAGNPVWSRDGKSITYLSADGDSLQIVRQSADGGGNPQGLALLEFHSLFPFSTPDGSFAVYRGERSGNNDIRVISLREGRQARSRPLIATQANEWAADFSPDGRWLPVRSDESGRYELSLRSFPDPSVRLPVSSDGISDRPFWSHDGTVLFYPNAAGALIAIHLTGDSTLSVTSREVVRPAPRPRSTEETDADAIQPRAPDVRFYPSDIGRDGRLLGRLNPVEQTRLVMEPTWRP